MKKRSQLKVISLMFFPVVIFIFITATTQIAVSDMILNDNIKVEGEIFLENYIGFADATFQRIGSLSSWSQKMNAGRFELVLDGEAVLDYESGLVWQRTCDYSTARNWYAAQLYCYDLEIGGRKGWRLPTIDELATLVDPTQTNPSLPIWHLFSADNNEQLKSILWSSSTRLTATSSGTARIILFTTGFVFYADKDTSSNIYVRAVRSGQ